jgi:hypothetical protein
MTKKILLLICCVGLNLTSCKDATVELEKITNKACACKDAACAEPVLKEFATFAKDNKNARGDEKKAATLATKFGGCMISAGVAPDKLMEALKGVM